MCARVCITRNSGLKSKSIYYCFFYFYCNNRIPRSPFFSSPAERLLIESWVFLAPQFLTLPPIFALFCLSLSPPLITFSEPPASPASVLLPRSPSRCLLSLNDLISPAPLHPSLLLWLKFSVEVTHGVWMWQHRLSLVSTWVSWGCYVAAGNWLLSEFGKSEKNTFNGSSFDCDQCDKTWKWHSPGGSEPQLTPCNLENT